MVETWLYLFIFLSIHRQEMNNWTVLDWVILDRCRMLRQFPDRLGVEVGVDRMSRAYHLSSLSGPYRLACSNHQRTAARISPPQISKNCPRVKVSCVGDSTWMTPVLSCICIGELMFAGFRSGTWFPGVTARVRLIRAACFQLCLHL